MLSHRSLLLAFPCLPISKVWADRPLTFYLDWICIFFSFVRSLRESSILCHWLCKFSYSLGQSQSLPSPVPRNVLLIYLFQSSSTRHLYVNPFNSCNTSSNKFSFLKFKCIGVTLVTKTIQVSSAHFYDTWPVHIASCAHHPRSNHLPPYIFFPLYPLLSMVPPFW